MKCRECAQDIAVLDNEHLLACSGLTLHEYAIRHHLPLELLVGAEAINRPARAADYPGITRTPGETARAVLEGLRLAGLIRQRDEFATIDGEVRSLNLLLWDLSHLADYGFRFAQEYEFDQLSNRVVARNRLRALRRNLLGRPHDALSPVPPADFLAALATCIAHVGELQGGYLFFPVFRRDDADDIIDHLDREFGVAVRRLGRDGDEAVLLRALTLADTQKLFAACAAHWQEMPGVLERFTAPTPQMTVAKELVFDSAHFITDHPAKCSNLHGGRYVLHVKLRDRIDPATGCVVDYGYLKKVVTREVIELFDHHHLNYVAGELAWRSTTELLCVFIWERLIDHLPALAALELYETPQSWCRYSGPSLAEFQQQGSSPLLSCFQGDELGRSPLRAQLAADAGMPPRRAAQLG